MSLPHALRSPVTVLLLLSLTIVACSGSTGPDASDGASLDGVVDDLADASGDTPSTPDVPGDTARATLLPRCEDTEPMGSAMDLPFVASTLVGTIDTVATRVASADPTTNPSTEMGELAYRGMMLDQYRRGPGTARLRRVNLGGDVAVVDTARRSIAYFVHVSDYQFVDDESPARLAQTDNPVISGGLRPQDGHLARAISAMHRTLGRIERPARQYDFGIITGDCADSAQLNETRWFIAAMDGGRINPDSGADDDPVPGPDNDPKDPFVATAFPAPWLYVPGNHDLMVVGINIPDDVLRARAIGTMPFTGTRDYRRWYAPVRTSAAPADPDRRLIERAEIARELRAGAATPGPVGHGYTSMPDLRYGANYAYDAIPNLLRIVAIDTSDTTGGSSGMIRRDALTMWLVPELQRAQTDGMLVMLASHHPTTSIDRRMGEIGAEVADAVPPDEIERTVAGFSNVIAWLVGHEHDNRVRPIPGADVAHPGYWEIETSALADWPGETRIVELVNNGNGTLSIFATLIDFDTMNCLERRYRRLQMMDFLAGWSSDHRGSAMDRNVELVIPTPTSTTTRVSAASAMAPPRIESDTSLRGMP